MNEEAHRRSPDPAQPGGASVGHHPREPLLSSTLLMPGDHQPMSDGWEVKERLDHAVDVVIDAGECGTRTDHRGGYVGG